MSRTTVLSVQPAPVRGGPAVQHLKFLEALDHERFELHVLVPARQEMLREYEATASTVHVLPDLPTVPRSKSPLAIARYLREGRSIARDVRAIIERNDVRVVHTFGEGFPIAAWAARRRAGSVVHVIGMTIFQPPWVGALYSRLLRGVSDRIVCCQQLIAQLLRRHGVPEAKLRVVYNALDPRAIVRAAAQGPAPRLEAGTLTVGLVGELDRRKGHLILVAAAERVLRERLDVRFYLVGSTAGDDTYLREVEAAIDASGQRERIRLAGRVPNALAWIAAMDVYCISSISEALSVAGLEAMALGRPIVATRTGGNPEAVADGETGLLSAPLDPADFALKLLELLGDPARRRAFGEAGRSRVESLFTIKRNAELLASVFDELSPPRNLAQR